MDVVDAEIAMCEGRYEEALRHWEAAQTRLLKKKLDSGLIRFAKEKYAERTAVCQRLQTEAAGLSPISDNLNVCGYE